MTVTAVHFGTTSVPFTVVNSTTITTAAPAGLTGAQNVRVTTTHGQSAISAAFTYAGAPSITSLSVTTGPAAGGTPVTITGTGFTGATAARFGATNGTAFNVISDTQITVTSPAGSGAVQVVVVHPNGNSNGVNFTYAAALTAPVITSPNSVNATEGTLFSYTITASGNPAPAVATGFNATGLPAWLTRTNNVVSGTPPAGSGSSSVTFTVTANNSEGTSPGVLVTVNIAPPSVGWEIEWTFPNTVNITGTAGHIPLSAIPGWNPAWTPLFTEDNLYDLPTMADMPVNLFVKYSNNPSWVGPIHFDNWGPGTSAPNTIQRWGWNDAGGGRVEITGANSTGNPIQLKLVAT